MKGARGCAALRVLNPYHKILWGTQLIGARDESYSGILGSFNRGSDEELDICGD